MDETELLDTGITDESGSGEGLDPSESRKKSLEGQRRKEAELSEKAAVITAKSRQTIQQGIISSAVSTVINGEPVVCAYLESGKKKILIPYGEMYVINPIRESEMNPENESGRNLLRARQLGLISAMVGLKVPYVVRTTYTGEDGGIRILASRAQAMKAIEHAYFDGDNPRIKVGGVYEATISSVGRKGHGLSVVLGGTESVIPQFMVTNEWLTSLKDSYRTGEGIRVKVSKIERDEAGNVKLTCDHISVELADAYEKCRELFGNVSDDSRRGAAERTYDTTAVITAINSNKATGKITIRAWLPQMRLPATIDTLGANYFGRELHVGDRLEVHAYSYNKVGRVKCTARRDHGYLSGMSRRIVH